MHLLRLLGRLELILGLGLKVARVVALPELARELAGRAVHHAAALHRRASRNHLGPALDLLVVLHLQKLAGVVKRALR